MSSLPSRTSRNASPEPPLLSLFKILIIVATLCPHTLLATIPANPVNNSSDRIEAYERLYPAIQYPSLKQAINAREVFLIDGNGKEYYEKGHLPGAHSLSDREQLTRSLPSLKNYPIVVYCWSPQCTSWMKAADFATAKGYTNVMHYAGGIKEWMAMKETLNLGTKP